MKYDQSEAVIKSEVKWDASEGKLHHLRHQPSEGLILERNKRVRNEKPLKDLSFGRQIASVPFITWEWAVRNGFDLNCPDKDIARKEMHRFLTTTVEGRACMVQDHI